MVLVGSGSGSFDTDPDSGSSHFFIRIRIQGNDTDSMDPDPDPQHWYDVQYCLVTTSKYSCVILISCSIEVQLLITFSA